MSEFEVSFVCAKADFLEVMGVLGGVRISALTVVQNGVDHVPVRRPRKVQPHSRVCEVILATLQKSFLRSASDAELAAALKAHFLSETSASSGISKLIREGLVTRDRDGSVKLVPEE